MHSSAFRGMAEGIDLAFKIFAGLVILVPILIAIIIYLLVR